MTTTSATAPTTKRQFQDAPLDVKVVISGLWVTMLMVFAYVDIFGLFRADILESALDGTMGSTGLAVNQEFLTGTLIYILLPSLMVYFSLILKPRVNRIANIVLPLLYAVSIGIGCIGETWVYYLLGSAVEVVLLLVIVRTAWTWPVPAKQDAPGATVEASRRAT